MGIGQVIVSGVLGEYVRYQSGYTNTVTLGIRDNVICYFVKNNNNVHKIPKVIQASHNWAGWLCRRKVGA